MAQKAVDTSTACYALKGNQWYMIPKISREGAEHDYIRSQVGEGAAAQYIVDHAQVSVRPAATNGNNGSLPDWHFYHDKEAKRQYMVKLTSEEGVKLSGIKDEDIKRMFIIANAQRIRVPQGKEWVDVKGGPLE